jgi:hypothetical protein
MQANVSTELDVHNALRRRGVAYEVAQAMSFEVHELIINFSSLNSRRTHWRVFLRSLFPSWLLQTGSFMCVWLR